MQDVLLPTSGGLRGNDMLSSALAARQASRAGWPDGPDTYAKLFDWANSNARQLLQDSAANAARLGRIAGVGVMHNDCFSGLGTASITLKQSFSSLCVEAAKSSISN